MRAENGILHSRMNLFHVIGLPVNIEVAVESTPENSAIGKLTNQRSRIQRSFSKNAGFTGLRYSYTVVPKSLKMCASNEEMISLHGLWNRRQSTKFNRTAYIVQRAAEAVYSPQGQQEIREMVAYYMHNAGIIGEGLIEEAGLFFAVKMHLISGFSVLSSSIPGLFSIVYSKSATLWVLPALDSVPTEKGTSYSQSLAPVSLDKKKHHTVSLCAGSAASHVSPLRLNNVQIQIW